MITICKNHGLSLLLEGSLSKNTGQKFSDIDLAISGNIPTIILDSIISGYNSIIMTNYTEYPKGILILNYENGINVDLDIRETFLQNEIDENMVLCDNGFKFDTVVKRKDIISCMIPERPQWYKTIRLIHRCCIKLLCNKEDASEGLCTEVQQAILDLYHIKINSGSISEQMKEALSVIDERENVDKPIIGLFEKLFSNMQILKHNQVY
jgi:hypothetical protein